MTKLPIGPFDYIVEVNEAVPFVARAYLRSQRPQYSWKNLVSEVAEGATKEEAVARVIEKVKSAAHEFSFDRRYVD
ncbi:TPA: hypothetical protein ACGCF6_000791 [Stenotrophomonas maltophilia]